jgi:propanol-preferring alcohol dehydrogenase
MVLRALGPMSDRPEPLRLEDWPVPSPPAGWIRLQLTACGVCHTELDEIEGRLPPSTLPRVPGHQAVGRVDAIGEGVDESWQGVRAGVAWIFHACGVCASCTAGAENLCDRFEATGRDADGGYAEYMVAPAAFAHRIPDALDDLHAAPLLCAGAIGYRALSATRLADGETLGLTGFGASAHMVLQLAKHTRPRSPVVVFARSPVERERALRLGADWAGDIGERPPRTPNAIIDTTPAWRPVIEALDALAPGGRLVINAIRKEDRDRVELVRLDYARHLWREKTMATVANVTRADVREFLALAAAAGLRPEIETFPLEQANAALTRVRTGPISGAAVLVL